MDYNLVRSKVSYFERYGRFCAKNPWEVIVAIVTLTICSFSMEQRQMKIKNGLQDDEIISSTSTSTSDPLGTADTIVISVIRGFAILYTYYQFRKLQSIGSKWVVVIAVLFTVLSSVIFTLTVLNVLRLNFSDLNDALFCFLLMIDLSEAVALAQFALTASNQEEISETISRGISVLGPTITLDSLVEVLVIGVGALSGVRRFEILSYYAILSVVVNFVIFMTVYPACLSLAMQLSRPDQRSSRKESIFSKIFVEENQKMNPAIVRVKLIMSFVLIFVHLSSHWCFIRERKVDDHNTTSPEQLQENPMYLFSYEQILVLIIIATLIVKLIVFESRPLAPEEPHHHVQGDNVDQPKIAEKSTENVEIQTEICEDPHNYVFPANQVEQSQTKRNLEEILEIYRKNNDASSLSDEEIILLVDTRHMPSYNLEKALKNAERAVKIRRKIIGNAAKTHAFGGLPYEYYNYNRVFGQCCENVVGYVPVPVGIVGPLLLDGKPYYVPMATTEGCLVASTNRGCRAIEKSGVSSKIENDGMTRAPVVIFDSYKHASCLRAWLKEHANFILVKQSFEGDSNYCKLTGITTKIFGRYLFMRFVATTGDAMGMNMVSKGTQQALYLIQELLPSIVPGATMRVLGLSSNYCTDKKSSAVNWIEGRGKYVVCEAIISEEVVATVLKTTPHAIAELNKVKNFYGSAIAGSIGGFNAHASNIVTSVFIACGQDPAQNVSSSQCMTVLEEHGNDLYASCTMPSVEVGTVGGGTGLGAQAACLELLGVRGPCSESPGSNAEQLAKIVCATVLAGELSLMAALTTGEVVKSHMRYNRAKV